MKKTITIYIGCSIFITSSVLSQELNIKELESNKESLQINVADP